MAYNKPPSSNIPFKFTSRGYSKPYSESISFKFGPDALSNLKAAVNVISYDYVKECPTIVVGYSSSGVPQILQLPCKYGGIRDISAYIYGNPPHVDLGAYIYASSGLVNLNAYIKSTIQSYKNLGAYVKPTIQDYKNLVAAIRRKDSGTDDLNASLFGWQLQNLNASIGVHLPVNLQGIVNVIEIRNLPAIVFGALYADQKNLGAGIGTHPAVNLGAYITTPFLPYDLAANIYGIDKKELPAFIRSTIQSVLNLGAIIGSKPPDDLPANITGILFQGEKDLGSILSAVYGPHDLQAYLRVHPYMNLSSNIYGIYSGLKNLPAIIGGWRSTSLGAYISAISAVNLKAYITAIGKFLDLKATIIPKTIRMKRALLIPLLEHKDLAATINFLCFGSKYVNLKAYLYTIYKKDLTASIWGWVPANNAVDLKAYINTANYSVEDKYIVKFVPEVVKYTQLKLSFTLKDSYTVFDTLPVFYGDFFGANLPASITGILTSFNLSASITPILQANYNELPDNVWPKTHEIVIDFDAHWKENWRRTVELLFHKDGVDPYHYFYVDGNQQVYKLDRSRHWTIWAKSYVETDDMIERRNVRRKYIFRMSDYDTVDEAIRDIIDRVSTYRQTDLSASITSTSPILPPYKDLSASLNAYGHKWVRSLRANLVGVLPSVDLSATVTVVQVDKFLHFTNSGYTPDSGDSVSLTFE